MSRKQAFSERSQGDGEVNREAPIEVGIPRPPSLKELIAQAIQQHVSSEAAAHGHETFAESDDFEIDDDLDDLDWAERYRVREFVEEVPGEDPTGEDYAPPLTEHEQKLYQRLHDRVKANEAPQEEKESSPEIPSQAASGGTSD